MHARQILRCARVVTGAMLLFLVATPARAELRTETEITYTADVEEGELELQSRIDLTNLTPEVREGDRITRFFYEEIRITVPETVRGFQATSGGQALSHRMLPGGEQDGQQFLVAVIDLGRRLLYQDSMEVVIEYEIPGDPPRSETTFRINPAYINFAVVGWGDPGLVTVNVVTPSTFDLELTGSDWDETRTVDGTTVHRISGIEDPDELLIRVTGYDDSALVVETLQIDGIEIVVRAWPGDAEWSDQVSHAITSGLPTLMDLVGLPWTLEAPLPVNQSAEVSLAGYGGWYLRSENLIELSEWADPHVVLHELSHVWFNQGLFVGRWINEGLAEVYSRRAAVDAGLADDAEMRVDPPPADTAGVGPLDSWALPDPEEQRDPDRVRAYEEYGYAASNWVIQEVTHEIGFEAMGSVLTAADADLIAYRGAPPPEQVETHDDWRRLLDLVEELGGSAGATDLFVAYVTDEDLTVRSEARHAYQQLIAEGQGWLPPFYIREPMSVWDFDLAVSRITEAREILEDRFEAESTLAVLGVAPGATLEDAYETATETLDEARSVAAHLVDATETVAAARESLDDDRNLVMEIGLVGVDLEAEYREALNALGAEELDMAITEGREVITLVEGSERTGQLRLGVAGAGVVVVGGAVLIVMRRRDVGI